MLNKTSINVKDILFCSGDFRTKFIKMVDYYLGGLLGAVLRPSRLSIKNTDKISRILVIRPGGIGDAVLVIPFIKEVKRLFPDATVDILCEKRNAGIFFLAGGLACRILLYDTLSGLLQLSRGRYDVVFDTEQWHNSSAIFSYFSGGSRRVGFDSRNSRLKFYTDLVNYEQEKYEADNFLNLLNVIARVDNGSRLGPSGLARTITPAIFFERSDCEARPKQERSREEYSDKKIALCLSAGIRQRSWPEHNFQKLIAYLIKKGYHILLLGARKERKSADLILKGFSKIDNIRDFVAKLNLPQTAELLAASSLFIGLDSGILHLAYGLGLPTISLFGPGIIEKWAPRGSKHIAITQGLACSPCTLFGYTPRCRKAKCMEAIKPEDVISAIDKLPFLTS